MQLQVCLLPLLNLLPESRNEHHSQANPPKAGSGGQRAFHEPVSCCCCAAALFESSKLRFGSMLQRVMAPCPMRCSSCSARSFVAYPLSNKHTTASSSSAPISAQFVADVKGAANARVSFGMTAHPDTNAKPISLHASLHHTCTRLLVTVTTALLLERRTRFAAGFATAARVTHAMQLMKTVRCSKSCISQLKPNKQQAEQKTK
jgi:hypothetical protein